MALVLAPLLAVAQERVMESVVPALAYGSACSSTIELRNVGSVAVTVELEGHKASGALVGLTGRSTATVRLEPGERGTYRLDIEEETIGAWVKVREHVRSAPALAVSARIECTEKEQLRSASREVAFPLQSPWFSADEAEVRDGLVSLINVSERAARVSVCYSAGNLYSMPGSELRPVCSTSFESQVPPFGSREFPVVRDGGRLSLRTTGAAIVLEMLRPVGELVRLFRVDSSIRFGGEVQH